MALVRRFFLFLRGSVLTGILIFALVSTTVGLALKVAALTAQMATMSANAAATAVKHREEIKRAVARARAKARLRRYIAAIPIVGAGAVLAFEKQNFDEWKSDHPDGTFEQYSCEVAKISAELVDEVLADLPQTMPNWSRPSPNLVLAMVPECNSASQSSN